MAEYNNNDSTTLASGTILTHPIIAVGAYCSLYFEGTALQAGEVRYITAGGATIKLELDRYGKGVVSLMPFMRMDAVANNMQNVPCANNYWKGALTVDISEPNSSDIEESLTIYYIMGDCPPRLTPVTDVWRTYNVDDDNYNAITIDWADHYTSGVPDSLADFRGSWVNSLLSPPTNDNVKTYNVVQVCADKIFEGSVNFHFTTDKRTDDVVLVRWIDGDGGINCRKFVIGGEKYSGASGTAYRRPHTERVIVNSTYDYGTDEWQSMTPQRTITIGDDCIPNGQWSWLCGLATCQTIELYDGGVWKRCNITSNDMERDPRKASFSVSFTLSVPTSEGVEV